MNLLELADLQVTFDSREGRVRAVDKVDLTLEPGDRLALIGESGCGKTVLGMAIMGLLPENAEVGGKVRFNGRDLLCMPPAGLQQIRGKEIAMVMQNAANALDPVQKIGDQIAETLLIHRLAGQDEAGREVTRLLCALGFTDPARAAGQYPYEFSGGMRERILIAIALIGKPRLIIADEPTAGLDAEVKLQILKLLKGQLCDHRTLLLITHDLGTATFLSKQIAVMYAGEIVETGPIGDVLSHPLHPFSQGMIASLPSAGLHPIPGTGPSPVSLPAGCRFAGRCPVVAGQCMKEHPLLQSCGGLRKVRCFRYA